MKSATNCRSSSTTAKHLAVLISVFLLAVAPATIVNWVESHDFVLIAWNGGVNFFLDRLILWFEIDKRDRHSCLLLHEN